MNQADEESLYRVVSAQFSTELPTLRQQLEKLLDNCCAAANWPAGQAMRAALDKVKEYEREDLKPDATEALEFPAVDRCPELAALDEPLPPSPPSVLDDPPVGGMYQTPQHAFSEEQLTFFVEVLLSTALDRIESALPPTLSLEAWETEKARDMYINSQVDFVMLAVPILWAQLHNDGMGVGEFEGAKLWENAVNDFVATCRRYNDAALGDEAALELFNRLRPTIFPDVRKLAKHIVLTNFDEEYLRQSKSVVNSTKELLSDWSNMMQASTSGRFSSNAPIEANVSKEDRRESVTPAGGGLAENDPLTLDSSPLHYSERLLRVVDNLLLRHADIVKTDQLFQSRPEYRHGALGGIRDARRLLLLTLRLCRRVDGDLVLLDSQSGNLL